LGINTKGPLGNGVKKSAVWAYLFEFRLQVNSDPGFLDDLQEPFLDGTGATLLTFVGCLAAKLNPMPTQETALFHQIHIHIQPRQLPGRSQTRDSATNDENFPSASVR
jgi:hypothetical protein